VSGSGTIPGFTAIIPAGGVGSRLWPLSRADAPKFLHDLTGSGNSLLRDTWDRIAPLVGAERMVVVTGRAHRAAVEAQLPDLLDENILLESEPRDSTAAIGLAAAVLQRREPGVIVGAFAADHVIRDARGFRRAVEEAVEVARTGLVATVGITPTEPAIGFGYIHADGPLGIPGAPRAVKVLAFEEKPDIETAKLYVADEEHLWNAGMFVAKASVILDWIRAYDATLADDLEALAAAWDDPALRGPAVDRIWPDITKIAFDYAVAEPAAAAGALAVVPGDFDWDDVGDFASVARLHSGGGQKTLAILGDDPTVLSDKSTGVVVAHGKRVITLIGVQDIVVVDTPDALLVTTTEHAQRVKSVVDALLASGNGHVL
jgi:mannose-1-phosphate guanylyltransferase